MNAYLPPINSLPYSIQCAVYEVKRFSQAPDALVVASALANLSLACQDRINVNRSGNLISPASLYFLTIAESGERKTSVDRLFSLPIIEFEEKYNQWMESKKLAYQARELVWRKKYKELMSPKRKGQPSEPDDELVQLLENHLSEEPIPPKYVKMIYTDATPESICRGLYHRWSSAGVMSSEGAIVLAGRASQNLSMYNTLWDGEAVHMDRVTPVDRNQKGSFVLKNARLTISLMTQVNPLRAFMKRQDGNARDIGFLARMLVAQPASTQGFRLLPEGPQQELTHLEKYRERLSEILKETYGVGDTEPSKKITMNFLPEAAQCWRNFYNGIEQDLAPGRAYEHISDHASKIAENMARMAALFHYFEYRDEMISIDSVRRAESICLWYLQEFNRLFGKAGELSLEYELAETLEQYLFEEYFKKSIYSRIKKNNIRTFGPSKLRDKNPWTLLSIYWNQK